MAYRSSVLSTKVEIDIQELDAAQLVSREVYDDQGNIVGTLNDEEYDKEVKEAEGRVFFGLTASIDGQHVRIRSGISSPNLDTQRNERAFILAQGFAQIGDSIYKNFSG